MDFFFFLDRFGKFIELMFDKRGNLLGASIETYLLEKVSGYLLVVGLSCKKCGDQVPLFEYKTGQ